MAVPKIYDDGRRVWCKNGKRHRDDGPAIEWGNKTREWWKDGKFIKEIFGN